MGDVKGGGNGLKKKIGAALFEPLNSIIKYPQLLSENPKQGVFFNLKLSTIVELEKLKNVILAFMLGIVKLPPPTPSPASPKMNHASHHRPRAPQISFEHRPTAFEPATCNSTSG